MEESQIDHPPSITRFITQDLAICTPLQTPTSPAPGTYATAAAATTPDKASGLLAPQGDSPIAMDTDGSELALDPNGKMTSEEKQAYDAQRLSLTEYPPLPAPDPVTPPQRRPAKNLPRTLPLSTLFPPKAPPPQATARPPSPMETDAAVVVEPRRPWITPETEYYWRLPEKVPFQGGIHKLVATTSDVPTRIPFEVAETVKLVSPEYSRTLSGSYRSFQGVTQAIFCDIVAVRSCRKTSTAQE